MLLIIASLISILVLTVLVPGPGSRKGSRKTSTARGPASSFPQSDGAGEPLGAAAPHPEKLWARASSVPLGWGGAVPCQADLEIPGEFASPRESAVNLLRAPFLEWEELPACAFNA